MSHNPIRILYLHQYFVPPGGAGGTRSYEFARRLVAAGHEVCLITSAAMMPEPYRSLDKTTQIELDGIQVIVIPVPYANEMSFARRIWAFLHFALAASWQAMQQPADVVFATSTPLTIAIPAIMAKLRRRIPLVFEVRDLWPELPIAVGALRNPVAKWLAHALEWIAYHASAHIVALSPGMAAGVQRRGIPAERVTVIPNSCDVALFDVPASRGDALRAQLGLAADQPLIVYAGTFGRINGVSYLVDVAAALRARNPQARFLLVGQGAERDQVIARAQATGVLDQTLWVRDPIPKAEMPALLAAATVATSLFVPLEPMWNNSANKFFDALAAGKPVAINYGGWQADLLRETGAGVALPPADPAQGAALLHDLLADAGRIHEAGQAARALAEQRFHRERMAEKLATVLTMVAQGTP